MSASAVMERSQSLLIALVITAVIAIGAWVPQGGLGIGLVCLVAALASSPMAVAVIIVILVTRIANPGLGGAVQLDGGTTDLVSWAAMLAASGRIWMDAVLQRVPILKVLPTFFLPYAVTVIALSAIFSEQTMLSLVKGVNFCITASSLFLAFAMFKAQSDQRFVGWIKGLWLAAIVLSVPLLAVPSIGYFRDGQGFQGILNHPQAFTVFLAPLVIWALVQSLTVKEGSRAILIAVLLVSMALMLLTRGRTGPTAIVLAGIILLVFRPGFARYAAELAGLALSRPWVLGGLILAGVGLIFSGVNVVEIVSSFIFKQSGVDQVSLAFGASRGFIVDQQILNFQESPITGIGFGVSNSVTHALTVEIDPLTGLPVGAATEKANLFLAVLEETGLVGALAFAPVLLSMVVRMSRTPSLALAWAAIAALCTNVSEMTFFSFGGIGLYTWLIMVWAYAEAIVPRSERGPVAAPIQDFVALAPQKAQH